MLLSLLLIALIGIIRADEDQNGIHLKVVASKSQLIPRQDLDILKQEIEHDITQELNKLEEKWATEERLAQQQVGTWNMHGAPIFLPHQYNSPYLITQMVRNANTPKNSFKEVDTQSQQQQLLYQQQQQQNQQMFQYNQQIPFNQQQQQYQQQYQQYQQQQQQQQQQEQPQNNYYNNPMRFQEVNGQSNQQNNQKQKVQKDKKPHDINDYFKQMKDSSLQKLMEQFEKVKKK